MVSRSCVLAIALSLCLLGANKDCPAQQSPRLQAHVEGDTSRSALRNVIRTYRKKHEASILADFADLLRFPNVASDTGAMRVLAKHILSKLTERGIPARLLEFEGSPPAILGEITVPGATKTVALYVHYDGQPVIAREWTDGPWTPTIRTGSIELGGALVPWPREGSRVDPNWRVFARSTSDDKAPIVAILAAIDALRASRIPLSTNIKLFFEGEEEAGSPHLTGLLQRHASLLKADLWLVCDGPAHPTGHPQLVLGARGPLGATITAYGATRPLHSGHYGNWAPNPIAEIAQILSSMRSPDGKVLIAGFYDDAEPLSTLERQALSELPNSDKRLRRDLSIAVSEGGGGLLAERIMSPALNFLGVQGGVTGSNAPNAIPERAEATVDFRLVPKQQIERVREAVVQHLRALGFTVFDHEPTNNERASSPRPIRIEWGTGYPGFRTRLDDPSVSKLRNALKGATDSSIVTVPAFGASLGLYVFDEVLHVPVAFLSFANYDNSQHAANENIRIGNLWDGIEMFGGLLARFGTSSSK